LYGHLEIPGGDWKAFPFWNLIQPASSNHPPEELAWVIREYGEDGDPVMADRIAEVVMMYVEKRRKALALWGIPGYGIHDLNIFKQVKSEGLDHKQYIYIYICILIN